MRPRMDPELGVTKKDDDLHVKSGGRTGWRAKGGPRVPPRKTFKRLGLALLLGLFVYVFVHNIPTDLGQRDRRHPAYVYPNSKGPSGDASKTNTPIPNDVSSLGASEARDYDGPIRFLELAETLHAIGETKGTAQNNKNVLFMASTIKSANKLLPIACQMGRELRSYVHFALISRNEIPMKALRDMNGIGEDCHLIFHGMKHVCTISGRHRANDVQMLVPNSPAFLQTNDSQRLLAGVFTTSTTTCTRKQLSSTQRPKSQSFWNRREHRWRRRICRRPSSNYPLGPKTACPG